MGEGLGRVILPSLAVRCTEVLVRTARVYSSESCSHPCTYQNLFGNHRTVLDVHTYMPISNFVYVTISVHEQGCLGGSDNVNSRLQSWMPGAYNINHQVQATR